MYQLEPWSSARELFRQGSKPYLGALIDTHVAVTLVGQRRSSLQTSWRYDFKQDRPIGKGNHQSCRGHMTFFNICRSWARIQPLFRIQMQQRSGNPEKQHKIRGILPSENSRMLICLFAVSLFCFFSFNMIGILCPNNMYGYLVGGVNPFENNNSQIQIFPKKYVKPPSRYM